MSKTNFKQLLQRLSSSGIKANTHKAREWFRSKVRQSGITRTTLMLDKERFSAAITVGKMYCYYYSPKHAKILPYYDEFPLIFVVDINKGGFLGINLVRYLLEKEFKVIVLDLEKFDYADVTDEVESIVGDIRKEEDLERAMNGVDLVVNCAAALPLYTHEQIMSTDYKGVEKVLTLAKRLGVQRVIQISSSAVYGIPDHHPLYETDNLTGVGPYGEAKVLAERVCEKFRKEFNFFCFIVK